MMKYTFFALFLFTLNCVYCQGTYSPNKLVNKQKLYYPKIGDKFWFEYEPNLDGAEGWIDEDCKNEKLPGKKIIVLYALLKHKSHGFYKGKLRVLILDISQEKYIDFRCFKPDYEKGDWLGPKLQIPKRENWYK